MIRFPLHPATMIFPEMSKNDFAQLVESIRKHGQLEPVWLFDGQIIDGRHRQDACKQLGIDVLAREWSGEGSLMDFVCGLNLGRRHMSTEEKAIAAFRALSMYEAEAKERQRLAGRFAGKDIEGNPIVQVTPILAEAEKPSATSVEQASKAFGVSSGYIKEVKRIEKTSPETFKKIESGKITIPEAKRQVAAEKAAPATPPPRIDWKDVAGQLKTALACIVHANNEETRLIAIGAGASLLEQLRG